MRAIRACTLLIALSLFAPPAQALRCGSELVREGDAAFEVRRACGEPDWVGGTMTITAMRVAARSGTTTSVPTT